MEEIKVNSPVQVKQNNCSSRKLDTKGCCFLCFGLTEFKIEIETGRSNGEEVKAAAETSNPPVSLKSLHRYLQIDTEKLSGSPPISFTTENGSSPSEKQINNIEVDLCEVCSRTINEFSKLFQSFEKLQMEIHFWLERIQQKIAEAAKKPELVQNYSKRMTSDPETLTQLVFVDNLRKEIAKRSLQTRRKPEIKVQLHRVDSETIKKWSAPVDKVLDPIEDDEPQVEQTIKVKYEGDNSTIANAETYHENDDDCGSDGEVLSPSSITSSSQIKKESDKVPDSKIFFKNPKTGKFDCSVCQRSFRDSSKARKHNEEVHLRIRRFKCEKCPSSYYKIKGLLNHKKTCDGTNKTPSVSIAALKAPKGSKYLYNSKTKRFDCKKCEKDFPRKMSAMRHYNIIHLEIRYKCDICNVSVFRLHSNLKAHQKACKDKLQQRQMEREARAADPSFKHVCPTCGKRFKKRTFMETHRRGVHMKERQYACDLCDKSYISSTALKRHKDVVHLEKKFSCNLCNKQYRYKGDCNRHESKCGKKNIKLEK